MLKHKVIQICAILAFLIVLISGFLVKSSFAYLFIVLFVWIGLTAWGSFDIRLNYFLKATSYASETKENKIALTFDDGPHPITHQILDLLEKYQFKATFFCIGKNIEKHPDIFQRIDKDGHTIGNHTYSHPNKMGFLSNEKIIEEICLCNQIIEKQINKKPKLYRPPFGVTNPTIAKVVTDLKIDVIGWSIRSLDTVILNHENILKRIIPKIKPGAIVLFHDTSERTVFTLEQLLLFMEKQKYQSVTVDELLKRKPYEN